MHLNTGLMDSGAHFHRCDFQVHTPRDTRWQGARAVTPEERRAYAIEFVTACRVRGLDAVAITDHHDMAFIPYLREAAEQEIASDEPPSLLQRLTIFPGMELTLGIPCQALVLFDADFPEDLFALVRNTLAIDQADDSDSQTRPVERLDINSFGELTRILDRHAYLRGRYIVIPNVSEGGTSTLLRSGHAGHYREMPCVCGYLDGSFSRLGTGNREILSGRNVQYGHKSLGLFQTSDNRRRDFADLGAHTTWVKWALPTAEALRQACLARESRICQQEPYSPSVVITSVSVSNSRFLGPLVLEFNPQYNAIIGGRGTGKSTILEYLRWALCDEPLASEDGDAADTRVKRKRLIDKTLVPLEGSVQVTFSINGVHHMVRRHAHSGELALKIGDGPLEPCTEADIRTLLPVQAYSQKQLSSVGVRLDELKRFVRMPIRQALADLERRFVDVAGELRAEYGRVQRRRLGQREFENIERELRSAEEQITHLRASLEGIDPAEQEIIDRQHLYERADTLVSAWLTDVSIAREAIAQAVAALAGRPTISGELRGTLPHTEVLQRAETALEDLFATLRTALQAATAKIGTFDDGTGQLATALSEWAHAREGFRQAYEQAKTHSSAQQSTLDQLKDLEDRVRHQRDRQASLRGDISALMAASERYTHLRTEWRALHDQRATLIETQANRLTELSDGAIRARLEKCAVIGGMAEKFRAIISGTNIRAAKLEKLCERVTQSDDPIAEWLRILDELERLALHGSDLQPAAEGIPHTPILSAIGFTPTDISKLASRVSTETWLELALVVLDDQPVFEYRAREGEYIPFADASAGQQATALLWALLNQEGPPLLIDQPEDDLDNQVVLRIVEQIWKAKKSRQLLFSSHNANLVVNGDAELVICCDYRVSGEQASGYVKLQGAIDITAIRDEITSVMEGGRSAFKLRMDKYGF